MVLGTTPSAERGDNGPAPALARPLPVAGERRSRGGEGVAGTTRGGVRRPDGNDGKAGRLLIRLYCDGVVVARGACTGTSASSGCCDPSSNSDSAMALWLSSTVLLPDLDLTSLPSSASSG